MKPVQILPLGLQLIRGEQMREHLGSLTLCNYYLDLTKEGKASNGMKDSTGCAFMESSVANSWLSSILDHWPFFILGIIIVKQMSLKDTDCDWLLIPTDNRANTILIQN